MVPSDQRQYDVVLMGATGFTGDSILTPFLTLILILSCITGKLAAEYLAHRYGTKVKWAIAGHRLGFHALSETVEYDRLIGLKQP